MLAKWCCARLAAKQRFRIYLASARPLRIVLPSLIIIVAFLFTRIIPERSKVMLAHAQFSQSAILLTLVQCMFSNVTHMTLDLRLPLMFFLYTE